MKPAVKWSLALITAILGSVAITSLLWYFLYPLPRSKTNTCDRKQKRIPVIENKYAKAWKNISDEAIEHQKRIVDYVNANAYWKAEYNPSAALEVQEKQTPTSQEKENTKIIDLDIPGYPFPVLPGASIPKNFDSREKWPNCSRLHVPSSNQGSCGSCWAVAATSTISDRICIHSNAAVQVQISTLDLMSCLTQIDCSGGFSRAGFSAWKGEGIVSGGDYGTTDGCQPYPFSAECGGPCPQSIYDSNPVPKCENRCHPGSRKTYETDKHKAKQVYMIHGYLGIVPGLDDKETHRMAKMTEIMQRGPITNCFSAHEDLLHYKSGVYKHVIGKHVYGHCVKLIGWGEENGERYWIIANSWGNDWGMHGKQVYGHCVKPIGWGEENGERYWIIANSWGNDWGMHGKQVYGHCVKPIGWGEENGERYWIIANSWGNDWGMHGKQVYGHCVKPIGWGEENGERYWIIANSWATIGECMVSKSMVIASSRLDGEKRMENDTGS